MLDKLYFGCFLLMWMFVSTMSVDPKCEELMTEGEGEQHLLRYYFSSGDKSCIPFFYKGEGGNFNNFESDRDCVMACSPDSTVLYPEGDLVCSLPVDVGECFAMHLQYYYSVEEKTCRLFHYGGCKGNGNRFETRDECLKMCQAKSGRALGAAPDISPDATTVDRGLIVGVLGGVIFAVAVIASIAMFVVQRKGKERKRVPTAEVEMS
ncbi:actinia tenebrosa protease inhibitors [Clupea harengus]|uniref:Actinia tenebrosa protease inhibitors n=1 Tax=Clupea harengus TaxID=7950 RepID=A0A6P3WDJ0_CLUHA|nr:actinia tenebrosa protease inhibitors [Clupea harengus]